MATHRWKVRQGSPKASRRVKCYTILILRLRRYPEADNSNSNSKVELGFGFRGVLFICLKAVGFCTRFSRSSVSPTAAHIKVPNHLKLNSKGCWLWTRGFLPIKHGAGAHGQGSGVSYMPVCYLRLKEGPVVTSKGPAGGVRACRRNTYL